MVTITTGNATPEKRKGRATLTVRDPLVESLLRGLGFEDDQLAEIRHFCKVLVSERNRWDIARRGGNFAPRKLSEGDAERAWLQAFAKEVAR